MSEQQEDVEQQTQTSVPATPLPSERAGEKPQNTSATEDANNPKDNQVAGSPAAENSIEQHIGKRAG